MIEKNFVIFKNCTALIVDDDISLLEDLEVILRFFFKEVLIATDGNKAFEIYKKNKIDVIFSDYVMPDLNGYELCKKIREIDLKTPIVILSSHSDRDKLLSLIDMNLSGYIIKPYNFEDITNTLKKIIKATEENSLLIINLDETTYFNTKTKVFFQNDEAIKLTKNEVLLLELFINNPNQIISQERIDHKLSPDKSLTYQASKNVIYRFRKKIGKDIIQNVQSLGYIYHTNKQDT